jgi:transposase
MPQPKDDLSRSLVALDQSNTLIAVVELSSMTWLVGGMIPGVERDPLKKLVPDADALLRLLHRWRDEAIKAGHKVERMVIAFEAGRDGFWLARWLRARGIEACVIHPTSIAVSREQRRAKTDRLDIGLLKRSFLGWLRGEKKHCTMAALPTLEEEDAKRPTREREQLVSKRTGIVNRMKAALARLGIRGFNPNLRKAPGQLAVLRTPEGCPLPPNTLAELTREMAHLRFIDDQIKQIEDQRLRRLKQVPQQGSNAKVLQLARIRGVGLETADVLTHEVFSRALRDQRAVARYAGLTGSPDESGRRRREKGLAKAGNARVRRSMIQLAWRYLLHQKDSALVLWYHASAAIGKKRKTMIVALARKLLIALWRFVTTGDVPQGGHSSPRSLRGEKHRTYLIGRLPCPDDLPSTIRGGGRRSKPWPLLTSR